MSINEWIAAVFIANFLIVLTAAGYLADYWLDAVPAFQREVQGGK